MTLISYEKIWHLLNEHCFEYNDNIGDELMCSICHTIMKNACSSSCCCKYCFECISNYLNGGSRYCPGQSEDCKENLITIDDDIQINHSVNKRLSKLIVKCPEELCLFHCQLIDMSDHIKSHNDKCPFFEMGCTETEMENLSLNDHLNNENYFHTKLMMESFEKLKTEIDLLKINSSQKEKEFQEIDDKITTLINLGYVMTGDMTSLNKRIVICELDGSVREPLIVTMKNNIKQMKCESDINQKEVNIKINSINEEMTQIKNNIQYQQSSLKIDDM